LGAGPAFESDASHYERDELPHTLACRKIVFNELFNHHTDFILSVNYFFPPSLILRPSTAYDFYSVICIFVSLAFISTITLPAYLFIYTLVLFWRRESRTVGSSKGCLSDYVI
jgi:hypothetical protein